MRKAEYFINNMHGHKNNIYPKVNGYVEELTDSNGNTLTIGYDKRDNCWIATELHTGFCVSIGMFYTKKECAENVHNNFDDIVCVYNKKMTDEKYYQNWIKPFEEFASANGGF